ncbi:MAG: hypothetical protein ACKVQA_00885 [Burkholderiales bacterium]
MEDDLLFRLALCADPKEPETSGIVEKALRSMNPEIAKDKRDRAARAARAARLRAELIDGSEMERSAVYPGLGERWGRQPAEGLGIRVPAESLRRLTEKIVRGIFFLEDDTFLDSDHSIGFYALSDEGAGPIKELLHRFGKEYARGPGIVVRRAVAVDRPTGGVFQIEIWGLFTMYASVGPHEP